MTRRTGPLNEACCTEVTWWFIWCVMFKLLLNLERRGFTDWLFSVVHWLKTQNSFNTDRLSVVSFNLWMMLLLFIVCSCGFVCLFSVICTEVCIGKPQPNQNKSNFPSDSLVKPTEPHKKNKNETKVYWSCRATSSLLQQEPKNINKNINNSKVNTVSTTGRIIRLKKSKVML